MPLPFGDVDRELRLEQEPPADDWPSKPAVLPEDIAPLFRFRDNNMITPSHPESFGESLERVHETRSLIMEQAGEPDLSMLMVTHGHFIREFLNMLFSAEPFSAYTHDNCGLTALTFDGDWSLDSLNG